MKIFRVAAAALLGNMACAILENDALAAQGLLKLQHHVAHTGYPNPEKCTLENASVRREWSRLRKSEKLNFIDAVKCLGSKPAKTPAAISAGARSRYDDFVVDHILQTLSIHGTANFLSWHRYYIHAFEQVLRGECGYKGHLPYWNWALTDDPHKHPLLDGSETSVSGDGAYVPGRNYSCLPQATPECFIQLPPAQGGGCITSGPFKDWELNVGPCRTILKGVKPNPQADCLGYNPRCLSRDLNANALITANDELTSSLIKNYHNISTFQSAMQGDFPNAVMGVHLGGHYAIGGDAGGDFYNSPADPAFWFHHAMIDRVWWTWQNLDIATRQNAIAGTLTLGNRPPTREGRLNDTITVGYVGLPNITIADAMHTLGGPFCYIYA